MSDAVLPVVILDASALYPAALRNLLMRLAGAHLFRPKWTARIQEEWTQALLRTRPELAQQIARTRTLMEAHVLDAEVTGYEQFIDALDLPDPNDRHVLAAAIHCDADIIVTVNLKDFPEAALRQFDISPKHPDNLVLGLLKAYPARVLATMREHRLSLKNPPKTIEDYLATLRLHGLVETVEVLEGITDRL
ncbi:MAG: PIN domain-containing protein [Rhodomicrobium sp.]